MMLSQEWSSSTLSGDVSSTPSLLLDATQLDPRPGRGGKLRKCRSALASLRVGRGGAKCRQWGGLNKVGHAGPLSVAARLAK